MCQTFSYVQDEQGDLYHCRPKVLHVGALGVVDIYGVTCLPGDDPDSHTDICRAFSLSEDIDGAAKYEYTLDGTARIDHRPSWATPWHVKQARALGVWIREHMQELLADLALHDTDWRVRREAIKRVENQEVLADLVLHDTDCDVRCEAIKRIENQEVLETAALNDTTCDVRCEAIRRVENQEVLETAALHDTDYDVRCEAIRRVEDLTWRQING